MQGDGFRKENDATADNIHGLDKKNNGGILNFTDV